MASLYRVAHFDEARTFVVRWHTSWSTAVADKEERELFGASDVELELWVRDISPTMLLKFSAPDGVH
jgi:hypothetical protein